MKDAVFLLFKRVIKKFLTFFSFDDINNYIKMFKILEE